MKAFAKVSVIVLFSVFGVLSGCGEVNDPKLQETPDPETRDDGTQIYQASGIVKAVDENGKQITIDHGDIKGLMSAMTMDFRVADPSVLKGVSAGDNVDFELEKNGSEITLTKIIVSKKAPTGNSEGAQIFKSNCAECHGESGGGTEKGISFLEGHALDHPREDFVRQVKLGDGDKMPSFGEKLSQAEIEAVVTYVREVIQKDVKRSGSEGHDH
ncbi:MAG: hypothetical protein DWQ47_12155 [Acidobacteria bacterium]|nr:MAG: hypothetical protein DWQ32_14570 [Acidobacteriota bacterium]REJ98322.1 MAG: hypothetical protein DWQ38_17370 [Acidobacteriota bacterium]REK17066.1 MAG: hypothetical protein DWQ43_02415 [Acidobacteriota bacterium]REK42976.1 MAG: hypothetical protein DWQ47_12155 [Acidobacteriota bacterium]